MGSVDDPCVLHFVSTYRLLYLDCHVATSVHLFVCLFSVEHPFTIFLHCPSCPRILSLGPLSLELFPYERDSGLLPQSLRFSSTILSNPSPLKYVFLRFRLFFFGTVQTPFLFIQSCLTIDSFCRWLFRLLVRSQSRVCRTLP